VKNCELVPCGTKEQKRNSGLAYLNLDKATTLEKTFVVIGIPRGGTTMVARALACLDIAMGVPKAPIKANYEDPEFVDILHTSVVGNVDISRLRTLIAKRNDDRAVWGFKVPMAIISVRVLESELRNPHFVFVFRDLLASAMRNKISTDVDLPDVRPLDLLASIRIYHQLYGQLWNFLGSTQSPCFLVSYEKAILNPELFVSCLARFVGRDIDSETLVNVAGLIEPDHPDYVGV
jgi:hypothetical protein